MRRPELTVSVRLRAEDAEELWHYCESQLDSSTGPTRWVWWRIAQASLAAIQPPIGACRGMVDRHAD